MNVWQKMYVTVHLCFSYDDHDDYICEGSIILAGTIAINKKKVQHSNPIVSTDGWHLS